MQLAPTIIETERLILRRFIDTDFEDVYAFNSNPEVIRYTGDELVSSKERAKEIIKKIWKTDYALYGYGRWATVYKPDNKVIGFTGLKYLPDIKATDIGYRYLPEYWGKGIATEAAQVTLSYGFEVLNLDKIVAIAMKENIASQKVLEKIGMRFDKIDEYEGDGGAHRWYVLRKEEYEEM